jgi:large subunit ribosomal protein L17
MRHNNTNNNLGRKSAHRKAMMSNMASSLILHKRIKTTTAKAKALRVFIEPILTKSKEDSTHARRLAFSYLQDKNAVSTLFREVSPKISDRPGGYTRILKIGTRAGDAAEMCYIELVDFNETMLGAAGAGEAKTTRRGRRGSRKKAEETKKTEGAKKPEGAVKTVETASRKTAKTIVAAEPKTKKAPSKAAAKSSAEATKAPKADDPSSDTENKV